MTKELLEIHQLSNDERLKLLSMIASTVADMEEGLPSLEEFAEVVNPMFTQEKVAQFKELLQRHKQLQSQFEQESSAHHCLIIPQETTPKELKLISLINKYRDSSQESLSIRSIVDQIGTMAKIPILPSEVDAIKKIQKQIHEKIDILNLNTEQQACIFGIDKQLSQTTSIIDHHMTSEYERTCAEKIHHILEGSLRNLLTSKETDSYNHFKKQLDTDIDKLLSSIDKDKPVSMAFKELINGICAFFKHKPVFKTTATITSSVNVYKTNLRTLQQQETQQQNPAAKPDEDKAKSPTPTRGS